MDDLALIAALKAVALAAQRFREHETLRSRDELFEALDSLEAASAGRGSTTSS